MFINFFWLTSMPWTIKISKSVSIIIHFSCIIFVSFFRILTQSSMFWRIFHLKTLMLPILKRRFETRLNKFQHLLCFLFVSSLLLWLSLLLCCTYNS